MKLEESRAYLALGWKAGIAGVNKPISSAQLDSQEKPQRAKHKAYKEATNASMTFATLTGQWPMGGINFYLQTSKDFLVI